MLVQPHPPPPPDKEVILMEDTHLASKAVFPRLCQYSVYELTAHNTDYKLEL